MPVCRACSSDLPQSAFEWRTDAKCFRRTCLACRTAARLARPAPATKVCRGCKRDLPSGEFYRNQGALRYRCRQCEVAAKKQDWARIRPVKLGYHRSYYIENRETLLAYQRQYVIDNREQVRTAGAAAAARRRARLKQLPNTLTVAEWREILEVHDHRCAYCLDRRPRLQPDHVVAVARGGGTTADNIVPACPPCNGRKLDKPIFTMACG